MVSQQFSISVEDYPVMSFSASYPNWIRRRFQSRTRNLSDLYRRRRFFVMDKQTNLASGQYSVVRYGLNPINVIELNYNISKRRTTAHIVLFVTDVHNAVVQVRCCSAGKHKSHNANRTFLGARYQIHFFIH